ncbi:response regulator [Spirosoma sp. BT702]|uniref:histidine kinase n=1 Tax=Spirosoma profusum TaxID=2771354 RepID=A0A926XT08_9BACT|nr:ATP-binding protein [Spirosoma profusum]MBD2699593.1 response regulator [Spirosoma profusum]
MKTNWSALFLTLRLLVSRAWIMVVIGPAYVAAQNLPAPEIITSQQGLPQAFVPSIIQDNQGFIWMATRDGLCRYDGNTFKVFQPSTDGSPSLTSSEIVKMVLDHQGKIWLISETGDLDLFDPAQEAFINVSRQPFYREKIGLIPPDNIYLDSQNLLWLCLRGQGLASLDFAKKQIKRYQYQTVGKGLSSDTVRSVIQDQAEKNIFWVVTGSSLDRLNRQTGAVTRYHPRAGQTSSVLDNKLKELKQLPSGDLLLRSNAYVMQFDPKTAQVRQAYPLPVKEEWWQWGPMLSDRQQPVFLSQGNILYRYTTQDGLKEATRLPHDLHSQSLLIDRSDVLWVGTNGGGVLKYNLRAGAFTATPYHTSFYWDLLIRDLNLSPATIPKLPGDWSYLFRYTTDGSGKLWFNIRTSPFYRLDLTTRELSQIPFPVYMSTTSSNLPVPMATDSQGKVWAVYDSTVLWYNEQQKQWIRFPHSIRKISTVEVIEDIAVDGQALWIASKDHGLYRIDRATGAIRRYVHNPTEPFSISNDHLFCLSADPADSTILWIGTFGGGLCRFDKRTGRSRRLTTADGLPNNVIYAAIPDRQGNLWVATNQGLGQMDRRTFKTRIYTREDGLAGDEFNRHHFLQLPTGRIFMGGLEGITSFDPGNLREDTYQPTVQITNIQINNQPMPSSEAPVQTLDKLTLPYDKNFVTVQFAAMQYNRRNKIRYRYQLEGLENSWTETDRPIAVYTGLRPGHYTLRLNVANTSGVWSPQVRTLTIDIEPPFWATWWAYIAYVLVIGGVIFGVIRASVNRIKLRQWVLLQQREVELKHKETEQLRATNDMKTRFFANISHEFRTPLTLILAPTEQMASENPTPKNQRRLLSIEQNAQHLLRLINQLLDLSKLEASVMPVQESVGNVTDCIKGWLQPLIDQAAEQGIALAFHSEVEGNYYFDAEKLERIVYNLTANALKFTKNGTITVTLTTTSERIKLTIADTGIGIPEQNLPHIFDRFYQADNAYAAMPGQTGTGIGLALVKELVQLQKGIITVESRVNEGTTFFVELPYRQAATSEKTVDATLPSRIETDDQAWAVADEQYVPRVLIVEDNNDLAHFIAESLPSHYRIRRAVNGRDGLEQAIEHLPDLIISDVMMPEMDGFTLCSKLKTDLQTSHIPVIMLTAKSSPTNRTEGLLLGADDYLTKPFQVQELQLRVHNQLTTRQRMREWVRINLNNPDPSAAQAVPELTDPFLTQLYGIIDNHLSDVTFGVDIMMAELGMSRTNLFRKVKALTGLSANDLLRQYRLKRATQLLRSGITVTDTAYQVGFDSPAYFTKCFREVYQTTPREFATQA